MTLWGLGDSPGLRPALRVGKWYTWEWRRIGDRAGRLATFYCCRASVATCGLDGGQKQSREGLARMLSVRFSVDKGTLWSEHEVTEAEWQLNDEEEWTVSVVTGQKRGPVSMATWGKKARSIAVWDKLESPCAVSV